jgi:NAD(P)-dependent dehydrogenase (short-subunit alcohol dehydrogenase family)
MSAPQPLADRVVFVTGATGGLGQVLALAFARAGATVVLHARVVRKLEALFDRIVAAGGPEPAILPLDFERAAPDAFGEAADAVGSRLGRLDAIVHCAATLKRLAPFEHHSAEDWAAVLKVDLTAPALLTRALLPLLRQSPRGSAVFTLDSRGHKPGAYWGSYAAAKAGLEALVRVLGDEWESAPALAAIGIVPGPIATPMRRRTHPGDDPATLTPPEALAPLYLQCVAEGGARWNGRIVEAAEWPAEMQSR